jgi:hypothetical protein
MRISFPQKKWFRKRASILRYTYIASLVYTRIHAGKYDVLLINLSTFAQVGKFFL